MLNICTWVHLLDKDGLGLNHFFKWFELWCFICCLYGTCVMLLWSCLDLGIFYMFIQHCFPLHTSLFQAFSSLDFLPLINTLFLPMNQICPNIYIFILDFLLFFWAHLWKQWNGGHLFPPSTHVWGGSPLEGGVRLLNSLTLCQPPFPAPWWVVAIARRIVCGGLLGLSNISLPA